MAASMRLQILRGFLKYFPTKQSNRAIMMPVAMQKRNNCYFRVWKLNEIVEFSSEKYSNNRNSRLLLGFLVSLSLFQKSSLDNEGEVREDELILAMKKATLAQQRLDFKLAEKFFHDALHVAAGRHQNGEMNDVKWKKTQTIIFGNLSNLALMQGHLENAEKLYKETMKGCLGTGLEKNDNSIVEISLKLATIYAMMNRTSEAVDGYKFCITTQQEKVDRLGFDNCDEDTIALLGMSYNAYARYLTVQNQHAEAKVFYEKALDISEEILGHENEQTLVILSDLASTNSESGNLTEAEKQLKKVVSIATKNKSPVLPAYLCNLGAIFLQTDKFEDALKMCKKSFHLAKDRNDEFTKSKAKNCINLAEAQKKK